MGICTFPFPLPQHAIVDFSGTLAPCTAAVQSPLPSLSSDWPSSTSRAASPRAASEPAPLPRPRRHKEESPHQGATLDSIEKAVAANGLFLRQLASLSSGQSGMYTFVVRFVDRVEQQGILFNH
jgi:hypothetical protein